MTYTPPVSLIGRWGIKVLNSVLNFLAVHTFSTLFESDLYLSIKETETNFNCFL